MEQLAIQGLYGLGILLAGYGGHRYGRKNGNWDGKNERRIGEPAVTQRLCDEIHKGLNTRLDEGNQKMERMGDKLDIYTQKVTEALTIVKEHTRNT